MTDKPVIFVVENDDITARRIEMQLSDLPPENQFGLTGFRCVVASSLAEAREKYDEQRNHGGNFHLGIFDLGLPRIGSPTNRRDDDPSVGLELLRDVQDGKLSVGAIVVQSAHLKRSEVAIELLKLGQHFTFINKPWKSDEFAERVCEAAVQVFREQHQAFMDKWRWERWHKWFLPQQHEVMLDEVERTLADSVGRVRDEIENLARLFRSRLQLDLDRDRDDSFCQSVHKLIDRVKTLSVKTRELRSDQAAEASTVDLVDWDVELRRFRDLLRPGIVSGRVEFQIPTPSAGEPRKVMTVAQDLRELLKQIILGAIDSPTSSTAQPSRGPCRLEISLGGERRSGWQFVLRDYGPNVYDATSAEPFSLTTRPEDDFELSLRLCHRLAEGIGARLEVRRPEQGLGNCVILHVPSMDL